MYLVIYKDSKQKKTTFRTNMYFAHRKSFPKFYDLTVQRYNDYYSFGRQCEKKMEKYKYRVFITKYSHFVGGSPHPYKIPCTLD